MPRELKNIEVTYISLVQAGANKKNIILKSDDIDPTWEKQINITKKDDKEGIVYGIVYSPDEVDTQGDFAKAQEIKKAAYNFMKNKRVDSVDTAHSFKKAGAYIGESWIIRKDDPLFPKEKEGSWAVGIKIEDEELKKAIEEGKIKALSMAGTAKRQDVEKADTTLKELISSLKEIFSTVNFSLGGYAYQKNQTKGDDVEKDQKDTKLQKEQIELLKSAVNEALEPFAKKIESLSTELKKVGEKNKELETALKKSNQNLNLKHKKELDSSAIVA